MKQKSISCNLNVEHGWIRCEVPNRMPIENVIRKHAICVPRHLAFHLQFNCVLCLCAFNIYLLSIVVSCGKRDSGICCDVSTSKNAESIICIKPEFVNNRQFLTLSRGMLLVSPQTFRGRLFGLPCYIFSVDYVVFPSLAYLCMSSWSDLIFKVYHFRDGCVLLTRKALALNQLQTLKFLLVPFY